MTTTNHRSTISLALAAAALLAWAGPAMAEDCGSPCTVTRAGLPTFRLINTAGVDDWDLETSAFGVELAPRNDSPNTGAFRVEHGAPSNTFVITDLGRVGIGTTAPAVDLQINSTNPWIRLNDTFAGAGRADLEMSSNTFRLRGNSTQRIVVVDTRAPINSFSIMDSGRIGIGTCCPSAMLHVAGDARVDGNVTLGSSRTLKTDFDAVDPAEVLVRLADLPVAAWRYKTEDESTRHIGPFAEDFQRLFGLGDGATISIVDAQGVAFAAIQGLQKELAATKSELERRLDEKDAAHAREVAAHEREVAAHEREVALLTQRLAAQNAVLAARLAALEERLESRR